MKTGKCAYCGKEGPLTKEEAFPKFLAHKAGYNVFVDRRRGRSPLRLPPVLRDVCQNCNNVLLGRLDTYASQLFKLYFRVPVSVPVLITFQYDFGLLHRWLLKLTYNFARAISERVDVFQQHIPYILGDGSKAGPNSCLLVGVFEQSPAQANETAAGMPPAFAPMFHTIGQIKFANAKWVPGFLSFGYAVSVISYCFQVLEFCDGTPRPIRQEIIHQIQQETTFSMVPPDKPEMVIDGAIATARDFLFDSDRVNRGDYWFTRKWPQPSRVKRKWLVS